MRITDWLTGIYRTGKRDGKWTSIENMGRDLGPSGPTLHRWMTGTRNPSPLSCVKLARATGTSVSDVLTMAGYDDETLDLLTG